jgi:hypothetical protein
MKVSDSKSHRLRINRMLTLFRRSVVLGVFGLSDLAGFVKDFQTTLKVQKTGIGFL